MLRYLWVAVLVTLVAFAASTTGAAKNGPPGKVTICHKAGSHWVKITISKRAWPAHKRHGDLMPSSPSQSCAAAAAAAQAPRRLKATLAPVAPNTTGSGTVMVSTRFLGGGKGRVCLNAQLTGMTAQSVWLKRVSTNAVLAAVTRPTAAASIKGCVVVAAKLVRNLRNHPANFSVNVGTAPDNAVLSAPLTAA
jgi:hypothetical protein